jgi:biopolymer transport protein ExbD
MPKVKVPRKNISLDMTAMCDMAFLLLTFFMLTTKFKPQEAIMVDMPSSVSEIKLPEKDVMVISVDKKGDVFFGIDGQNTRMDLIDKMSKQYNIHFSDQEKQEFSLMPSFGVPVSSLKGVLNLSVEERNNLDQPGIPCDSVNNELSNWVKLARQANPQFRFAIKGDREVNYEVMDKVIATLQDQNINKFNLITTMEVRPN